MVSNKLLPPPLINHSSLEEEFIKPLFLLSHLQKKIHYM